MMRHLLALLFALAAFLPQDAANEELVGSWYPILQVGNTWVYAEESRDADNDHGIDDPTAGTWTTTETVSSVEALSEGVRVTIQSKITDLVRLKGWSDDPARTVPAETQLVVRGKCIYRLETTPVTLDGVPPAYCFPMKAGTEWGRAPSKDDEYDIWHVKALNADPSGVPGARTFHVYGYQGSGNTTDYWFQEGVGIVQYVDEHHGTYDWHRKILLRATINGETQAFTLQPARIPPLEPGECRDGSRQWVRADGTLLPDLASCIAYARTRHRNPEPPVTGIR